MDFEYAKIACSGSFTTLGTFSESQNRNPGLNLHGTLLLESRRGATIGIGARHTNPRTLLPSLFNIQPAVILIMKSQLSFGRAHLVLIYTL